MTFSEQYLAVLAQLRAPFDRKQIGKLPATAKRPALDYVGHAAVTDRLNLFAPEWTYVIDERFDHGGQCWVRGTMTICGISRTEYGDGADPKEATSNFIRRAAMRYGVALDLWSKEELSSSAAGRESDDTAMSPPVADVTAGSGSKPASARRSEPASSEGVAEDDGEASKAASSGAIHIHEWHTTETSRPGWLVCDCGKAEKASKVSA